MRKTFFSSLESLVAKYDDMYVLTGDLGYKLFDGITRARSDRFYNAGIAEGNMIGVAAGLALSGNIVYCYSIVPFLIMRAYEQIRLDVDYHCANVRLVGVGSGFTYGLEGITHFGLEDFALMLSLQNTAVVSPADQVEASAVAVASYTHKGPMYIRLGRTGAPAVYTKPPRFTLGEPVVLRDGKHAAIFATGDMVHTTLCASEILRKKGINIMIINVSSLKPLDKGMVLSLASKHDTVFTAEEHNIHGGLGTLVGDMLLGSGYKGLFDKIGVSGMLDASIGTADYLRIQHSLDAESIAKRVECVLKTKGARDE